jgi:superfamily II DNA/RNA helicase
MTKKDQVITLLKKGESVKEISKQLDMLNANVYKIRSEWKTQERLKALELQINK